jgi:putative hydrolase of the HAD superfamily
VLYVLDLDDTLYLEHDFVQSGFKAVGRWLAVNRGVDSFFEKAWQSFHEGHRGNIFDIVLADLQLMEDGLVKRLISVYRNHNPSISLASDAIDFLKTCEKKDLAIITDGYANVQRAKIKALGLDRYVDRIIVTGDWGKAFWKPHLRSYMEISNGHDPADCVYIADNPTKDFKAPNQLGWAPSIRIRRPGSLHFDIATPKGCKEITSFTQF